MSPEEYLTGLYAVRMENIEKLMRAFAFNATDFSIAAGRNRSFFSQLKGGTQLPNERVMRDVEHAFGYDFDSMDREDFQP